MTGLSKKKTEKEAGTPAWQKTEGKNDEGGLNANSRINKSLRKWNCKCASAFEFGKLAAKNWIGREDNSFDGMHVTNSTFPSIEGAVKSLTGVTLPFVDMTSGRGFAPLANNAAVALEGIGSRVGDTFKNLPTPQAFGGAPAQGPMPPTPPAPPSPPGPQQKSGAQAVPPAVANDLGRSSLINVTSDFNDRSQAAALLGALFPTAVGGVAGALSSRKGKRLAGAARGAGIGAAYTVGSHAGSSLGGLASGGNSLAQLGGGLGGGVGSALLAANLLPEIKEEKQSMANPHTFGEKLAATPGGMFGKALGALGNMGKPAVKTTANVGAQLPPPRLPLKPGTTPASLERTTGTILNSAGAPVPKKAPPPVPTVPKVKISPAETAAAAPQEAAAQGWLDPDTVKFMNRYNNRPGGEQATMRARQPGGYNMTPQEMAAREATINRERYQALVSSGQTPTIQNMGLAKSPAPAKDWGRVPTGPTSAAQAQSFFDNATGAGRQRMLGLDPQARPAPAAAPQSWTQLSPAQQQAVQGFYSGGQGMTKTQSAHEFGAKLAQSTCSPCDMPNGPTNKKHMTGASPAVLEADEKSEELGRPESEETEHSEKAIDIPGKAAAFGAKLAANYGGVLQHPNQFDSANKDLQLVNPATGFSQDDKMTFPYDGPTPGSVAKSVLGFLNKQRLAAGNAIGETVGSLAGAPVSAWTGPSSPKPPRSLNDIIAGQVSEHSPPPSELVARMNVDGSNKLNPAPASTPAKEGPGMMSQILGSPYTPYVAGGLGATGLAALAYHLMNQKPKKKREEDRGEDKE